MSAPPVILGVDFSGAADAGRRIWVARARDEGGRLRVEACLPAEELPGSGPGLDASISALVRLIGGQTRALVGMDFPFGLPLPLVSSRSWEEFVREFPLRYEDPHRFRAACRSAAGGFELKRLTDKDAQTPFSAYNLRLFRQTYHGIRDLLCPLVMNGHARALPMQRPTSGRPSLIEICPASTLMSLGIRQPYKGRSAAHRDGRERILEALQHSGLMLSSELKDRILACAGGDALDSAIAACGAHRAWRNDELNTIRGHQRAIEGHVFV